MVKKNRKVFLIILSVIAAVVLAFSTAVGTYMWHEQRQQDEMVKIVESDDIQRLVEIELRNLDNNALTDNGLIKTYRIDVSSIRHNPMGGINFTVIINNNENLYIFYRVEKNNEGSYRLGGGGESRYIAELIREGKQDE